MPSATPVFESARELKPALPEAGNGAGGAGRDRLYLAARLLWEHRQMLGQVMARGMLLFLLLAFLLPASYESKTQLMPPDPQSATASMLAALAGGSASGSGGGSGALSMAADLLGLKTSGALFISILNSETVEDRIINQLDLRRVYWVRTYRQAREKLAARSDIKEDKKSGVITIAVSDHNRHRASAIARAYVAALNQMVAELNTSAAHRERVFLEERLAVVKQELDQSAKQFSDFSSKSATLDLKEQGKAMVEAAATLQGQVIAAQSELRGLEQIYTPNNVRVRSVRARIGELQLQLQKLGGSASQPDAGAETGQELYPSLRQLPVVGLTYADLYRRLRINETVFEILTKEYELARVQEAKEVPTIKVIDPAEAPEKRSGPPRTLIVLGGTLLSFGCAGAWLFGREAWQHTDPHNPRRALVEEIAAALQQTRPWQQARAVSLKVAPAKLWPRLEHNRHHDDHSE